MFLQNMLTNDVNALSSNQAQLTGFCNPKGRLLAIFQLIRRTEDYLILLPSDLAAFISQRLSMFKLRSKVDIALCDDLYPIGLLDPISLVDPVESWYGQNTPEGLVIRQPGDKARYLLIADETGLNNLKDWLNDDWLIGAEEFWQSQNIQAGLPAVFESTKEAFTPQQVNLDLVGGVSFKKGCYPGQEVVARLHYLGTPSRRMFLAKLQDSRLPSPHTVVCDKAGEVLGHVVQAQFDEASEVLCQLTMKLATDLSEATINDSAVDSLIPLAQDER